ncbi:1-acyl-sn-glycerol-3-phosphate acyltransferase [bacterium]|nr:1-acyl-sn-glycerol-3-phosphate acyltransferase [bacterium]
MSEISSVRTIQSAITDEIFYALGLGRRGVLRRGFGWIFTAPAKIFAKYMAVVDEAVAEGGAPAGCRAMMEFLKVEINARGIENVPKDGPTILLANHPGAYDSMAIGSLLPRPDLKAIVSKTRLYEVMPNVRQKLFYVTRSASENMQTLRNTIEHLQDGGALLQFGSGRIEPDPATEPVTDAVFDLWSKSIEVILRKVPEALIVPTIASDVLLSRFRYHFLTRLRKTPMDKRRLAEFMQVIRQLIFPKSVDAHARISFGEPFRLADLAVGEESRRLLPAVIERMKAQLAEHMNWIE